MYFPIQYIYWHITTFMLFFCFLFLFFSCTYTTNSWLATLFNTVAVQQQQSAWMTSARESFLPYRCPSKWRRIQSLASIAASFFLKCLLKCENTPGSSQPMRKPRRFSKRVGGSTKPEGKNHYLWKNLTEGEKYWLQSLLYWLIGDM